MAEKMKTAPKVQDKPFKDDEFIVVDNEFEQIRKFTSMYISYVGSRGALHIFKEIFNNALDECVNPLSIGDTVEVYFDEATNDIMINDNGRGIPFEKFEDTLTKKHSTSKNERKWNADSAGQNGVGLKLMCALSDYAIVTTYRGEQSMTIEFKDGVMTKHPIKNEKKPIYGLYTKFKPSEKYLGPCAITSDQICEWMRQMSYICPDGIKMKLIAQKSDSDIIINRTYERAGLAADVIYMAESLEVPPITLYSELVGENVDNKDEIKIEMSFSYDKTNDQELIDSYCNYVHTTQHGKHVEGCESALCAFLTKEAKRLDPSSKYEVIFEDCRKGLILAVNCRAIDPQFGGQTKDVVNASNIRDNARRLMKVELEKFFTENQSVLKKIVDYLRKIAKIRISSYGIKGIDVKKPTTWIDEAEIKNYIPLADRNYKGYKELLIVEGNSASGGLEKTRNPKYQAAFILMGVVANTFEQPLSKVMGNSRSNILQSLVKILGCGIGKDFNISNLKWNRIIIVTDADTDGSNITSLLCAFFAAHMPGIIEEERLYKSVPPLYSIDMNTKKSKKIGRDFLFDKREYYSIYHKLVSDNVDFALMYQDDTEHGHIDKLTWKEKMDWLEMNTMYLYHLNNLRKKSFCLPIIIETVCWELLSNPAFSIGGNSYGWEAQFKSVIEKDFPEVTYDVGDHSLIGSYNTESVSLIVDQLFIKNATPLIKIMAKNPTLFVYYKNKNDSEEPIVATIGGFLAAVDAPYSPDVEQRFKGIGELPEDLLFRSVMNPTMRKLYKITMSDVDKAMKTLAIIHGEKFSDERKKLIDNDNFTLEDIDN